MAGVLTHYPYLSASLLLVVLCLAGLWRLPQHRKPVLISAAISVPDAAYELLVIPAYWSPTRVLPFAVGVEDLLFNFAIGGLVWLMATAGSPPLQFRMHGATMARRWLAVTALFLALMAAIAGAGVNANHAPLLSAPAVFGVLLWRQPSHWRLAVRGAFRFGALYAGTMWGFFRVWPAALSQWNLGALTGILLLGVPVEELAWGVAYGAVWPLFMAFLFDADPSSCAS